MTDGHRDVGRVGARPRTSAVTCPIPRYGRGMAVVKINAIEVPEGAGPELEKRFAARAGAVEKAPGFLGFELLRPVSGDTRYFVYTRWETEEDFQAWAGGPAKEAHSGERAKPVASGADLLEFEVVQHVEPSAGQG
ncbi:Heme-degrading monooxygenase HmoA [Actinoalloteichus cyanogriseus DSM 43889]|uniref:Heme-degrading monooxygenase HmoA n=2 Tax=Pseudonocardiaceae TaxID=2070 RepID=A0ABT1JJG7_ACTCY|nr:Heme-degrading monooxygenase HmoA [Actinoalloteichus caeruleus DSM 43889]